MKEIIETVCHQEPGYKWCLWSSSSNFPLAFAWNLASYLCIFFPSCAMFLLYSPIMPDLSLHWPGLSGSGSDFLLWSWAKPSLFSFISPIFNQTLSFSSKPDCQFESTSSHLGESSSGGNRKEEGSKTKSQIHQEAWEATKAQSVQAAVTLLDLHRVRLDIVQTPWEVHPFVL